MYSRECLNRHKLAGERVSGKYNDNAVAMVVAPSFIVKANCRKSSTVDSRQFAWLHRRRMQTLIWTWFMPREHFSKDRYFGC